MAESKLIAIGEIKPNKDNPRIIKDNKFKQLVKSIKDFPQMLELRPIVVNDDMVVLGGNMRLKACKEAGLTEVPIIMANELTNEQQKEFIVKDNVGFGEWDWDILANEWDADLLEEWGLDGFPFDTETELEAEEDDYTEPNNMQVDVVVGDLIEIGEHRLLCGDSTDSDQVARLMNGEKADMVFTDPPYGVSYQSNMRTKTNKFDVLKNDDIFITDWINNLPLFSNGFVFVWTSWKVVKQWIEFCEPIGELSNVIIWDKGGGGIGDLEKTFLTDFEIALCYHRNAKIIGKRLGSVWSVGKDVGSAYLHPTQKPIGLASLAIENILEKNKIVLDLFLGSGSTMVASHQLKRKCYGMELDPKYCQVIIDRMIKLDDSLEVKINGKKYEQNRTPYKKD
jgi:DNA modification methylase